MSLNVKLYPLSQTDWRLFEARQDANEWSALAIDTIVAHITLATEIFQPVNGEDAQQTKTMKRQDKSCRLKSLYQSHSPVHNNIMTS